MRRKQLPARHLWPLGQTLPHAPQLFGSISVRTHSLPQIALGAKQTMPPASQLMVPESEVFATPLQAAVPATPACTVMVTKPGPAHWNMGAAEWVSIRPSAACQDLEIPAGIVAR